MRPLLLGALILFFAGCRCQERPPHTAVPGMTNEELRGLLANRPKQDCSTFQIVDRPDGTKGLECVEVMPDAGAPAIPPEPGNAEH